jgi:hypothetical protein
MIDSWTTDKNEFKDSHQNFNPGIPVDVYGKYGNQRNTVTQSDYEKYLWLFGNRRV